MCCWQLLPLYESNFIRLMLPLGRDDLALKTKVVSDYTPIVSLRERLKRHAQFLSGYQFFLTGYGELASRIVKRELDKENGPEKPDAVLYVLRESDVGATNWDCGCKFPHPENGPIGTRGQSSIS